MLFLGDCGVVWSTGALNIPNHKYQINHNDQNSKFQTCFVFWSLDIGTWGQPKARLCGPGSFALVRFRHLTCREVAIAMAGNLLSKSWLWLYCWLRASGYWFSKVATGGSIRFRHRLLKVREKKSMLKMGRRIHELHQDGQNDWSGDSKVKEILQVLEERRQMKEDLKSRLQGSKDRYREKVQKLRDKASSQTKGTERETGGGE
jgi:hypothetical protein